MKFLFECPKYFTSERSEKVKYFFNTSIIGVYRVYSITRVNIGIEDIYGYTGYTVLLG